MDGRRLITRRPRAYVVVALAGAVLASVAGTASSQEVPPPAAGEQPSSQVPPPPDDGQAPGDVGERPNADVALADATLREVVSDLDEGGTTDAEAEVVGERVHVEVLHHTSAAAAARLVRAHGGRVTGSVPGVLVEGDVPFDELEALEAEPAVDLVRPPLPVNEPVAETGLPRSGSVLGEEVAKTQADLWQQAGATGAGVRVGIIDSFDGTSYASAQAAGEVPAASGTFCRQNGAVCNVFDGGSEHGVAVAEIIHDMAPSAQIYLGSSRSTADTQALVDYFISQGVDIVTRSLTSPYDGPGNGTGPLATVIDNAVAGGIAWFQSAGNNSGDNGATRYGSYYRWTYADADNDGYVEFAPGDETLRFWCGFQNGLRWNDFGEGSNATDYDFYVYDPSNYFLGQHVDSSLNNQGAGALPIERTVNCVPGWNILNVVRFANGTTPVGDVLEFSINGTGLDRSVNPGGASGPAADQNSPGAMTVGAIDPAMGTAIAIYSSQGPTNDNRIKPDISAAACVQSQAYSPNCFSGTSAATPVVAGGAALVLGAGVASTPAQLRNWILGSAVVERGAAGADNIYGAGEFILPSSIPPPPVYRPDGRIRTGTTGPILGNNVYNSTGASQTVSRSGGSGANLTYTATFQNDGNMAERFRLRGTPSTTKFTATYRVNGINVTSSVVNGSYQTSVVPPGALVTMSVTVKVKTNTARNNSFTGSLTARSVNTTSILDVVKFTARRS